MSDARELLIAEQKRQLDELDAQLAAEAVAAAERAAAKAKAETEPAALLPRAEGAALVMDAMLEGERVCLDFEGANGEARHVDVFTKSERMPKEETLAMRELLNSQGRTGLEAANLDGMNGLIALYKPGKSTCLSDRTMIQLLRSFTSLESKTDTMTANAYAVLLPLYKLMKRRAK
jgi:hypothetical protein